MARLIQIVVALWRACQNVYARKWSFAAVFVLIFFGAVTALAQLDLLPEPPAAVPVVEAAPAVVAVERNAEPQMPLRVEAPSIGLAASVSNPDTTVIEALDASLKHGAVRYPTSARLGETGNVVLFGHSSYLPIVLNPAYKTFNGIQKLTAGDSVIVYSSDTAYTYRVRSMTKESANNAGIPLAVDGRVLTLATCDSFGQKSDRFVVVADFVESHAL
ncbi:MAG TPA: sortase [Nevskia sp.]|nr:sortase [Nevskia sp.]